MILVTGATGKLGHFVVDGLLARGIPPSGLAALVRSPEKARSLAERGLDVRWGDYHDRASLDAALVGIEKLVFISGSDIATRTPGHLELIAAARRAGVKHVAYTSAPHADTSPMKIAQDHLVTEEAIRASGVPFTLLRNGWYFENYTENLGAALEHGVLLGAGGDGKYSMATREDFAGALVEVITGVGHENRVYELGGEPAVTLSEVAAEVAHQSGKPVTYVNLTPADYEAKLSSFGVPPFFAHLLADSDGAAAQGHLFIDSGDLPRLLGHRTTSLAEAVRRGLAR